MKRSDIKKANILLALMAYLFKFMENLQKNRSPEGERIIMIIQDKLISVSNMVQKLCME